MKQTKLTEHQHTLVYFALDAYITQAEAEGAFELYKKLCRVQQVLCNQRHAERKQRTQQERDRHD